MRRFSTAAALMGSVWLVASFIAVAKAPINRGDGPAVLWRDPGNIGARNLLYGSGGTQDRPIGPFVFDKEVDKGTQPKIEVTDANGIHWTAKMGLEARPETVASRFLWAVGYFADEEYFVPAMPVENLRELHRGSEYVTAGGIVHGARLKRQSKAQVEIGSWEWGSCPFVNTREWNGLRVMMALINNWDVKNVNNSIYQVEEPRPEQRYLVADLGASFGPTTLSPSLKGNFRAYRDSKWIRSTAADYVDFNVPGAPTGVYFIAFPIRLGRLSLDWVGRHIPRADARWIGDLLGRLSPNQIRDAFRAADYPADEVEGFSEIVEHRIHELQEM